MGHNQVQLLWLNPWEERRASCGMAIRDRPGTGSGGGRVGQRLELTTGVSDVSVSGSGSDADPWHRVAFHLTVNGSNEHYLLQLTVGSDECTSQTSLLPYARIAKRASAPANDRQQLLLPGDATEVCFWYGGDSVR